ncbi:MAG: hypothetical protein DRO13_03105 [Thermoprotei archaeon]|nr:MAG: hypothetical protein DRO13_03105 [Thermoprotei archaeon]
MILGPNGSGKMTLLKAVLGLAEIYRGRIVIDGEDVRGIYGKPRILSTNLEEVYRLLGLNALKLVELYTDLAMGDIGEALRFMESFGPRKELIAGKKLWELSPGQRRVLPWL